MNREERSERPRDRDARSNRMLARHGCTRSKRNDEAFCCQQPEPSTFGLSLEELWAEAQRLVAAGWSLDEVRAVLTIPETVSP